MTVTVTVKLRASKQELKEMAPGYFEARLTKPPFEGQANAELIVMLAKHFHVAKSRIIIASGASNRRKIVEVV